MDTVVWQLLASVICPGTHPAPSAGSQFCMLACELVHASCSRLSCKLASAVLCRPSLCSNAASKCMFCNGLLSLDSSAAMTLLELNVDVLRLKRALTPCRLVPHVPSSACWKRISILLIIVIIIIIITTTTIIITIIITIVITIVIINIIVFYCYHYYYYLLLSPCRLHHPHCCGIGSCWSHPPGGIRRF